MKPYVPFFRPHFGRGPKIISIDANRYQRTVYPHDAALNAQLQRALIAYRSGPANGGAYFHAGEEPGFGAKRNRLAADIDKRAQADARDVLGTNGKSHG